MAQATSDTGAPATPLDLAFRFADGRGQLSLSPFRPVKWLEVEAIDLEVPGLEPPIDLTLGAERFQNRRTRVERARVRVASEDLNKLIEGIAPSLIEHGIDRVRCTTADNRLSLTARFRNGEHVADLIVSIGLCVRGRKLVAVVSSATMLGYAASPAPLVAHRLLIELSGASRNPAFPGAPVVRGLGIVEVDFLSALLWQLFPPQGWRLPDTRLVAIDGATVSPDGFVAQFSRGPASPPTTSGDDALALLQRHEDIEAVLLAEDFDSATRAYQARLAAPGPDHEFITSRLLAISSSTPTRFSLAIDTARDALARWPNFPPALLALARVEIARGEHAAAAQHLEGLAQASNIRGEVATAAALAGARLLRTDYPERATTLFEKVLAVHPGHAESSDALLAYYRREGRPSDTVRVLKNRIANPESKPALLADQVALTHTYLESYGDHASAIEVAQAAVADHPRSGAAEVALAEALQGAGDNEAAVAALVRGSKKLAKAGDNRGEVSATIRAGDLEADKKQALEYYEAALLIDPKNLQALAGAGRAAASVGKPDVAVAYFRDLIDASTDVPSLIAQHYIDLGNALADAGKEDEAVAAYEWAAERGGLETKAKAKILLAEGLRGGGDTGMARQLLADAIDYIGNEVADLRQGREILTKAYLELAELEVEAGELASACAAYERVVQLADTKTQHEALRRLIDANEAMGDVTAEREWIDRLLARDIDGQERARLLVKRTELSLANDDQEQDDIVSDLERALDLSPTAAVRAEVLELKASVLDHGGDPVGRAQTLSERVDLASNDADRCRAAVKAARAWLDADRPNEALRLCQEAVANTSAEIDIDHGELWLTLGEAAWRSRAWPIVIRSAEHVVTNDFGVAPEVISERLHRAGIAKQESGDLSGAADTLSIVLEMKATPSEVRSATLRLVSGLYERLERLEEAAAALIAFADQKDVELADSARADAWFRAGELYRRLPEREEDAERCMEEALSLVDDHLPALDGLERIHRMRDDFERVAVILSRKIAATARHPNRQKALLARLADLQHLRLGRTDVARQTYARALDIDPNYRPALRFSVQDARERGDDDLAVEGLIKLAQELDSDLDLPDEVASLAEERITAALQLTRMAEKDESGELYPAALQALEDNYDPEDNDDRILKGMERLARSHSDFRRVADILGMRAAIAEPGRSATLDLERVELLANRIGDRAAALAAANAALARTPDDAALKEIRHELEASRSEKASIPGLDTVPPAELRARADAAIESSDYHQAAAALEELVLLQPLDKGESYGARAARGELFLELADLYYDRLGDLPRARESMRRAAEAFGTGARRDATLRLLASEAAAAGAAVDAVGALEAIEPHRLSGNDRLQLARSLVALERIQDASTVLEQARARGALTDEGAKLLSYLYRERERKNELAESLERGAEEYPPEVAETRLREALSLFEVSLAQTEAAERVRSRIADLSPAPEGSSPTADELEAAAEAALGDGDSAVTADLLSRAASERARQLSAPRGDNDTKLLATLDRLRRVSYTLAPTPDLGGTGHFEALVRGILAAAAVSSQAACVDLLREAGSIRRNQLRKPRDAAEVLSRAFALAPENEAIFAELSEALRDAGDYTQLIAAYETRLEHLEGPSRQRHLAELARLVRSVTGDNHRVRRLLAEANAELAPGAPVAEDINEDLEEARALEDEGEVDEAIARYYAAFAKRPTDQRPLAALDRLYGERGDVEAQANVLAQLVDVIESPTERSKIWYRRAQIFRNVLHRIHDTYRCMKAAYANDPENLAVAHGLRSLAMARGEWPLAAELLYREIAGTTSDRDKAALYFELGLIYEQKLRDSAQAIRNYEQALALDPSIPAAPAPLANLYEASGRFGDAARMFEMAAESAATVPQREAAIERAKAARVRAKFKPGQSAEPSAQTPAGAIAKLGEKLLNSEAEEWESIVEELLAATESPTDISATAHYVARFFAGSEEALASLGSLAESARDAGVWSGLARGISKEAETLSDRRRGAEILVAIGDLHRDFAGDASAAIVAYERALALDHSCPAALDSLANLAYLRSDWEKARVYYSRIKPEHSRNPAELLAFRRGEVAEMLGLDEEATQAFAESAALAPENIQALTAWARAATRIGDYRSAIDATRNRMDLVDPSDIGALTVVRLELAQLCDAANDIVTAIFYYELVLAEDPNNQSVLESLVTLYAAHGDHQGSVRTLRTLAATASDLSERAERHYVLGEVFRANIGDHEAAADEYLKAIDLDPSHAPTLRRLLDYYWTLDDTKSLLEIARDLESRHALIVIETPSPTLARVMCAAAMTEDPLAQRIAESLPGDVSHATAMGFIESLRIERKASPEDLAKAAQWLWRGSAAISREAIIAHLEDSGTDELVVALHDAISTRED